jgi:hypothetical protein
MFLILINGETQIGCNPPGDDILEGLLGHYGTNVRIVRAATQADHEEMAALRNAVDSSGDFPLLIGNTLDLADDGITIEARDKDGALIKTWLGVLIYPISQPPAPPAPIVDLSDLNRRMVALGSNLDAVALGMGMQQGQPITQGMAEALAAEVARQEADAHLPRVGQFSN